MSHNPVTDLDTFLAYSLVLEEESAERLREVADMMAGHQQADLAVLFHQLADYSDKHAEEVKTLCGGRTLPQLNPWDFVWPDLEPPETFDYGAALYQMTATQALTNMLLLERNTASFYLTIARQSQNAQIVALAQEFANEEQQHAAAIDDWLQRLPKALLASPDIDPPHQPE
jgi:rubrerythrin